PMYLLAYRFTVAVIGLVIVFWKKIKTITRNEIKYGSILGVMLFISYYFQTYGLKYTTASKNAFITTLYVIIVPFLHWLFNKVKP
ncbi:MAG: EamA family transporter, partial [Clostridium sp.]